MLSRAETAARNEGWVTAYDDGAAVAEIAGQAGHTRQNVSLVLIAAGRDPAGRQRARTAEAAASDLYHRTLAAMAEAVAGDRRCTGCGCWVIRPAGRRTCSPGCADALPALRWQQDDEYRAARRRTHAASILRHADRRRPSEVALARRILSDDPPPPNRRFTVGGSRADRLLRATTQRDDTAT